MKITVEVTQKGYWDLGSITAATKIWPQVNHKIYFLTTEKIYE